MIYAGFRNFISDASTTSKTTEKKATGKPAAPQYRPAPPPKENAWGRKIFSAEKPASLAAGKLISGEKGQ